MQFVGADDGLGTLRRGALPGQLQLRGDGRCQDPVQRRRQFVRGPMAGVPAHQVGHQGLGHAGVDVVAGHVVGVVGTPAKGQLGQVAGAHQNAAHLVGGVEQQLRPLAGLGVLEDQVVVGRMAQVLQMLGHGRRDGNLPQGYGGGTGEGGHGRLSVFRGARPRQGKAMQALWAKLPAVQRIQADQQGQGGVQPAGKA